MKRKIEIILLCLFILTIGCQKEELYSDSQENTSELTNLQLLKSNDLIVNDIMGSRTKSAALNNKVDYEYPWLLDLDDNKDRVLYCMDSEDNFTDRKIIYVKDGDKRFSYIVERAYVFSNENERDNMKGESIAVFSGIVTIYTADEVPVYSYFYSNNELVGETNLYEELKSNSSGSRVKKQAASDEAILNGGFLLEVDVFGNRHSGGGGSSTSGIWFLQNSGRYTNWSGGWSSPNVNGNYNYGGNNGGTNGSKPKKPVVDNISKYERVDIELAYLKQRGAKELAEIFEKLAFDPNLTVKDRIKLYDAIHEAYLQLQGEYMMAIPSAFAKTLKPLIDIALFNIGGEVAFKLLGYVAKIGIISLRIPEKGITVLGKYPRYIELASKLDARKFNIPTQFWNRMSTSEQWAANVKFLDRTIKRGDKIILSHPVKNLNDISGYYRKELDYLIGKGYKLSKDGTQLIK